MLPRILWIAVLLLPMTAAGQTTRSATVEDKLSLRLPELVLDGATVTQAPTAIAEKTRLNIVGEWEKLTAAGIDREHKLRGRLYDVTARQAIELVLADAGAKESVQVVVRDDVVVLSGPVVTVTRVYPVGRLLDAMPKREIPSPAPAHIPDVNEPLIRAVQHVEPESWRDAGGVVGSISFFGRRMVITHTPEVHAKVEKLLKDLEQPDAK
jgi:hypothetical protein